MDRRSRNWLAASVLIGATSLLALGSQVGAQYYPPAIPPVILPAGGGTGSNTPPTSGQMLVGTAGGVYAPQTLSGDITNNSSGVTTLKNTGPGVTSATNANVTIDAQGRVTALTSGSVGGNMSNTGTPVSGQVPIFTDATHIGGNINFTASGGTLTLGNTGGTTGQLQINGGSGGYTVINSANGLLSNVTWIGPGVNITEVTAQPGSNGAMVLQSTAGARTAVNMSGDATLASSGAITLKNTGPGAASFTSANITIDNQGRITAASNGSGGGTSPGFGVTLNPQRRVMTWQAAGGFASDTMVASGMTALATQGTNLGAYTTDNVYNSTPSNASAYAYNVSVSTLNGVAGVSSAASYDDTAGALFPTFSVLAMPGQTTNCRHWIGMTNATLAASATPAVRFAAFRYDTGASDSVWQAVTGDGTSTTVTSTGVSLDRTQLHTFQIDLTSETSIKFYIDGTLVATNTTHLPSGIALGPEITSTALTASSHSMDIANLRMESY